MTSKRILIADDDAGMRLVLKSQLNFIDASIELTFAADGKEAVALSMTYDFDLIFMDVQMPHMTGLEASIEIRRHEQATGKTKAVIIAITGTPDQCRCMESEMDDYLLKPAMLADIQQCVTKWISGRQ